MGKVVITVKNKYYIVDETGDINEVIIQEKNDIPI